MLWKVARAIQLYSDVYLSTLGSPLISLNANVGLALDICTTLACNVGLAFDSRHFLPISLRIPTIYSIQGQVTRKQSFCYFYQDGLQPW